MIMELTVLSSIPKQIRSTPTLTCRLHRRTARMNWWVSIRKRSAAPRASEEEPRCPLMPSTLEVSAGRAGRSTARLLLIMMATAVKPQLMMVGPPTCRNTLTVLYVFRVSTDLTQWEVQIFPSYHLREFLLDAHSPLQLCTNKHKNTICVTHTHLYTLSVNLERWSKRGSRSAHSPWEGCETVNCLYNVHSRSLALFFFYNTSMFPFCPTRHRCDCSSPFLRWVQSQKSAGTDLLGLVCYSSDTLFTKKHILLI